MNRRIVTATLALSLSMFATQPLFAAPAAAPGDNAATKNVKGKTVNFHLRNDSAADFTVQAGDQQITLKPGQSIEMKLQSGTQLTAVSSTAKTAAGSALFTVSDVLKGNTLAIS